MSEKHQIKLRRLNRRVTIAALAIIVCLQVGGSVSPPVAAEHGQGQRSFPTPSRVPVYSYAVVHTYPHDRGAFTQGLVYEEGALFESTGLYGSSSLRKVELQTGNVLKKIDVPSQYFAEGLALYQGQAIQLTWQSRVGFVYNQETFQLNGNFSYSTEGWGLTHDGQSLIMSDGTDQIRFLDPQTYQVKRTIKVQDRNVGVQRLNELEYIEGEIWANIWLTDRIVRISPQSGRVSGWIDLTGLLPSADRVPGTDVLNGIAYDAQAKRIFVTGKNWPKLFEIRLLSRNDPITSPQ
jgi:glutamine cyclotransferase